MGILLKGNTPAAAKVPEASSMNQNLGCGDKGIFSLAIAKTIAEMTTGTTTMAERKAATE
jgi:hypothetical protein